MSGDYAIVGALGDDDDGENSGSAYVYNSIDDLSLPVELSAFSGTIAPDGILLQWRTESETNNLGFRVYRSANKEDQFKKVAFVDGYGSTPIPHDYTFTDKKAKKGETYYYFLEDIDIAGNTERSAIITVTFPRILSKAVPTQFVLHQNYPNPFNPETWIPYELAADTQVTITIYSVQGHHIRTLELGIQPAGSYLTKEKAAYWDGRSKTGESVPSGTYFYHFRAGEFTATRKIKLLK
ncbi:T9SS type A sorting domain-containing protein [Candidatus Poribacteria bacterium]|nr:T9SS type A sorting domain-containing protein [Candidatus Poribacteria bacterium]